MPVMASSRKHLTIYKSPASKVNKIALDQGQDQDQDQPDETSSPEPSIPETIPAVNDSPPLLRVPSEIRREIFRYLIPSPTKKFLLYSYIDCDSTVIISKYNRQPKGPPDKTSLAILRTNRTIYHESLSLLYSENLFHFIGLNYRPVLAFIRRLSPDAKNLVRKVRLTLLTDQQGEQPANHDAFCTVIHDFLPGLTTLHADPWDFF